MSRAISRPVWVNGIRYNDIKAALEQINILLGRKVYLSWVSAIVKAGDVKTVDGVTISAVPPESEPTATVEPVKPKRGRPKRMEPEPASLKLLDEKPAVPPEPDKASPGQPMDQVKQEAPEEPRGPSRLPILRYPRGGRPLERGICHWK
jgi:hypothetical protein